MRKLPFFRLDSKLHLHLWEESLILSIVCACLEFQAPDHPAPVMLRQVREDLGQGWAFGSAPVRNPTVTVGESFHGRGGSEGFDKGKRDGEVRRREAGSKVKDMTCDRVARRRGRGRIGNRRGDGLDGVRHDFVECV